MKICLFIYIYIYIYIYILISFFGVIMIYHTSYTSFTSNEKSCTGKNMNIKIYNNLTSVKVNFQKKLNICFI